MRLRQWISFCLVFLTQVGGSAQDNVNDHLDSTQAKSDTNTNNVPATKTTPMKKSMTEANSTPQVQPETQTSTNKSEVPINSSQQEVQQQNASDLEQKNSQQEPLNSNLRKIDENTPRSKIDIEFDAIEGATKYQIELRFDEANFVEVYTSNKPEFHLRVPVAKYQVRARAADDRGVYSDWSDPMEVVVTPEAVKFPTNTYFHKKPNPEDLDTSVLVHWQASAQAISYEVVIKKQSGEIFETHQVNENEIRLKLPPGKFRIQVNAVGPDDIKNTEPPFEPEIFIEKAKLKTPIFVVNPDDPNDVTLEKMDIGEVNSRLEYQPWMTDEWYFVEEQFNINASAFVPTKKLKPGQYRLFIWLSGEGFEDSDETYRDFVIKPKEQDLYY